MYIREAVCDFFLEVLKNAKFCSFTEKSYGVKGTNEYSCAGVPLFRRNGNRQSGDRKPLFRNKDTALNGLLPASLLA